MLPSIKLCYLFKNHKHFLKLLSSLGWRNASLLLPHASPLASTFSGPYGNYVREQSPWSMQNTLPSFWLLAGTQLHFTVLIDQEMEGHLFWDRVLTNKSKYERCATTPQGKGNKICEERQSSLTSWRRPARAS